MEDCRCRKNEQLGMSMMRKSMVPTTKENQTDQEVEGHNRSKKPHSMSPNVLLDGGYSVVLARKRETRRSVTARG
jgi:hypothetical protein